MGSIFRHSHRPTHPGEHTYPQPWTQLHSGETPYPQSPRNAPHSELNAGRSCVQIRLRQQPARCTAHIDYARRRSSSRRRRTCLGVSDSGLHAAPRAAPRCIWRVLPTRRCAAAASCAQTCIGALRQPPRAVPSRARALRLVDGRTAAPALHLGSASEHGGQQAVYQNRDQRGGESRHTCSCGI